MTTAAAPIESPARTRRRHVPAWSGVAVAALVFAALAPSLRWLEFANGIEELHAATVLEIRRTGHWVIPTLNARERIAKPPLPAWSSAAAVTDATVAAVSSPDPAVRAAGYEALNWQVRWPVLLAGCLMLVATFDLGATLARSRRAGLAAATIAGTSLLFLHYARLGSTDVPLSLWVATTNALLARAALRGPCRACVIAAGATLGLAFMCKGPVALLQTLVPLAAWAGFIRWRRGKAPATSRRSRGLTVPVLLATAAFLAIALPWPLLVLRERSDALQLWRAEVTREGATDHEYGPVYSYLALALNLLPWLPAFVAGAALSVRRWRGTTVPRVDDPRREPSGSAAGPDDAGAPVDYEPAAPAQDPLRTFALHRGYLLALCWVLVPIVVMTFFRDKHERYLLPILPAAAVVGARGLLAAMAGARRGRPAAGAWLAANLLLAPVALAAVPAFSLARPFLERKGLSAIHLPDAATAAALAAAGVLGVGVWLLLRRGLFRLAVAVAFVAMLAAAGLFLFGYKDTPGGRSEMRPIAEDILKRRPDAVVGYYDPRKSPKPMPPDLAIYLDREVETVKPDAPGGSRFVARRQGRDADVLVVLRRKQEKAPPAVAGWRVFATQPYGKRHWHAMERE